MGVVYAGGPRTPGSGLYQRKASEPRRVLAVGRAAMCTR